MQSRREEMENEKDNLGKKVQKIKENSDLSRSSSTLIRVFKGTVFYVFFS